LSMFQERNVLIVLNVKCAVKPAVGSIESAATEMDPQNLAAGLPMPSISCGSENGLKAVMKKVPAIDIRECSDCEACLELCPEVFVRDRETGFIGIQDLEEYPEEEIYEVMSFCPQDCISFTEDA